MINTLPMINMIPLINTMPLKKGLVLIHFLLFLLLSACTTSDEGSSVIIYENALIYTCEDDLPTAQAMVVADGRILYVGDDLGSQPWRGGKSQVIDMQGKTILPGFVESHSHPTLVGALNFENLLHFSSTQSCDQVLATLQEYYKQHPQLDCMVGFGFLLDALGFPAGETPTKELLDAISTEIPIFLYDESLHSAWCNSKALALAHVDENTPDIVPGISYYVRYPGGQIPTGYLFESAVFAVANCLPNVTVDRLYPSIKGVLQDYSNYGFTAIVDVDNYFEAGNEVLGLLVGREELPFYYQKACVAYPLTNASLNVKQLDSLNSIYSRDQLSYTIYKLFLDGTIELESASLLEPYSSTGAVVEPLHSRTELLGHLSAALQAGYPVHIHAIGDKAQQYALDVFRESSSINPFVTRTIAHNQLFEPNGVEKFAALGASYFCQSTPSWAQTYAGDLTEYKLGSERMARQYLWGEVVASGGNLTLGSDYPANEWEEVNPFYQMYHAVKRREGSGAYYPPSSAGITRAEALKAYTINGARQMGIAHLTGSLKVGKMADFIVVNQDVMKVELADFKESKVEQLFFRGERIY